MSVNSMWLSVTLHVHFLPLMPLVPAIPDKLPWLMTTGHCRQRVIDPGHAC